MLKTTGILLVVWMALIFYYSIEPTEKNFSSHSERISLSPHLVAYFVLSVLFLAFFTMRGSQHPFILAISFAFLYGFFIEGLQYFIPYREFSLADSFMNFLGSSAILIFKGLSKKFM